MTIPTNDMSLKARSSLLIGHCVGLIDMVALPLWVGLLATAFRFDAQLAGGVVTLFLLGVVMASAITAPLLPGSGPGRLLPSGLRSLPPRWPPAHRHVRPWHSPACIC